MLHSPYSWKPLIRQWCACIHGELRWLRWVRASRATDGTRTTATASSQLYRLACHLGRPSWPAILPLLITPTSPDGTARVSYLGNCPCAWPCCCYSGPFTPGGGSCNSGCALVSKALKGLGKSHPDEDLAFLNHRDNLKPHLCGSSLERGFKVLWLSRICILKSTAASDAGSSSYLAEPCKTIVWWPS